jgi:hypothetical protein
MNASRPIADGLMTENTAAAPALPEHIAITHGGAARVPEGFDLLRVPGMRRLMLWSGLPYVVQPATAGAGEQHQQTVRAAVEIAAASMAQVDGVGYHFANLSFAAERKNWPLADFYLAETRSHLRWAVRIIPVRKTRTGHDVELQGILEIINLDPEAKRP